MNQYKQNYQQQHSHNYNNVQTMTSKSLRKQITDLFAYAGYKTNGLYIPPQTTYHNPTHKTVKNLTYKIDIAHKLYEHYRRQDFRFNQKGITPKIIAQQIAIYVYDSPHYHLDIDSFGYFLLKPTEQYYSQIRVNAEGKNMIEHTSLTVKSLSGQKWGKDNQKAIIYQLQGLDVSQLRIIHYLEMVARKYCLLGECSSDKLSKIVNLSKMTNDRIKMMLEHKLIDFKNIAVKVIIAPNTDKILFSNYPNFQSFQTPNQIIFTKNIQVLGGCFIHETIPYLKKYNTLLSENNIIQFGECFPNITIEQMQRVYGQSYSSQINRIVKQGLKRDTKISINLRNMVENNNYGNNKDGNEGSEEQTLVMVLDSLGDNSIGLAENIMKKYLRNRSSILFDMLEKQMKEIIG